MSAPFANRQTEQTDAPAPLIGGSLREVWAALEHVPGALLVLNAAGEVVFANGIAELRLDQSRGELLGRSLLRDLLPQPAGAEVEGDFRRAMTAGRGALSVEVELPSSRGITPLTLGIRPVTLERATYAMVLVEDRSALALERARRRQGERLAAIGELATGVAHEVNNPLATIKSFAQLLSAEATSASQTQGLEIISGECTRIARTVHNLLGFASRQVSPTREALDLSATVDAVVALKRYALETAGVTIEMDLDPAPTPVEADVDALQRVVLALVCHAERELAGDEADRRLTVRTRESTEGVTLYMIDNGPGIPRTQLPTLLHVPRDPAAPDPLGLDVAAALVREQGGQMWVDSVVGRGTAVFVRLPRPGPAAAEPADAGEITATPRAVGPMRILVADDESSLRLALVLFLGRAGHTVEEAGDARTALRIASEIPLDAALIDVRMPGDGIQLLEKLEAMPHLRGRTILMTGDATPSRVRDHLADGRPHLVKPFDLAQAARLIETLGTR